MIEMTKNIVINLGNKVTNFILLEVPKFDGGKAKEFADGFLDPAKLFLLAIVPVAYVLWMIWSAVKWFGKDEQAQEGGIAFFKSVKYGTLIAIIAMAVDVILIIFGI